MRERPTPDAPYPGIRHPPPPGALVPPRQRAKPARKSARCGVGDGSPRPHPPHPQPAGSGPGPHAPRTGGGAWEIAQPRTPHTQARGTLPPGDLMPPRQRAKPARKTCAVGLVTGPAPIPAHPQPVGSGPGPHAPRKGGRLWESAQPGTPHNQARGTPPPGALVPPSQRAKPAPKGMPARRGANGPMPGNGKKGPGNPPQSYIGGAWDGGRKRRGAQTAWNGPTSTLQQNCT